MNERLNTKRENDFVRLFFSEDAAFIGFVETAFVGLTGGSMEDPPTGKEVSAEEIIAAVRDVYDCVSSDGAYTDFLSTKPTLATEEIADYLQSNHSENLKIRLMPGTIFQSMTLQLFQNKLL
jgi:hypothetical protein